VCWEAHSQDIALPAGARLSTLLASDGDAVANVKVCDAVLQLRQQIAFGEAGGRPL
jgi:hypothetical protein